VPTYLVQVRLADRPGALGAVASRIGAVQGDVAGVEVVEQVGGKAVDEFVVELPDELLVELLVSEIEQVDGTVVEYMRRLPGPRRRRLDAAYDAALCLARQASSEDLLAELAVLSVRELEAAWAAVVEVDGGAGGVLFGHGRLPARPWLVAYAAGLRAAPEGGPGPEMAAAPLPPCPGRAFGAAEGGPGPEMAAARLENFDLVLVAGRPGWPFRPGERHRLAALATLADARWSDLARRTPHPAGAASPVGRNGSGSAP
jgi:hypothetical protein